MKLKKILAIFGVALTLLCSVSFIAPTVANASTNYWTASNSKGVWPLVWGQNTMYWETINGSIVSVSTKQSRAYIRPSYVGELGFHRIFGGSSEQAWQAGLELQYGMNIQGVGLGYTIDSFQNWYIYGSGWVQTKWLS